MLHLQHHGADPGHDDAVWRVSHPIGLGIRVKSAKACRCRSGRFAYFTRRFAGLGEAACVTEAASACFASLSLRRRAMFLRTETPCSATSFIARSASSLKSRSRFSLAIFSSAGPGITGHLPLSLRAPLVHRIAARVGLPPSAAHRTFPMICNPVRCIARTTGSGHGSTTNACVGSAWR